MTGAAACKTKMRTGSAEPYLSLISFVVNLGEGGGGEGGGEGGSGGGGGGGGGVVLCLFESERTV